MKSTFLILSPKNHHYYLRRFSFDFQNKANKTKNSILFLALLALSVSANAQNNQIQQDSTKVEKLQEVLLSATRAKDKTPVAFSNITKKELETTNLGQDLPILLDQLPSVVTTSDAGAGVGYTGIRVRGTDATRVNVTINGIPYNDSESQGTFWVNMPDFVSSVEDIQLQRGVGTSTNGSSAFGASLNIMTLKPSKVGYATTTNAVGSYGTRKHNISLGSGLNNNFYAETRVSKIMSDGYIDRASSDLSSYYVEGGFLNEKTSVKAIVFGGKEQTYQSWYGTPEAVVNGDKDGIQAFIDRNYSSQEEADSMLNSGRTYNYYTYDNEVDNYEQTHYQLHFTHQFDANFSANISGNYTRGKGYFEQYKDDEEVGDYFPGSLDASEEGDVIRRRWLDNNFYAVVTAFNYKLKNLNLYLGGGFNKYDGDHFGELIWDSFPISVPIRTNYYTSLGEKTDYNTYLKAEYTINSKWFAFADVQYRLVDYKSNGLSSDLVPIDVKKTYDFFNPKAGVTFSIDNYNAIYGSVAVANREPNRDDLTKNPALPNPERLLDYEFGYKLKTPKYYATANVYYMDYKDQLVLTGDLDNVGDPIRMNVAESYRAGIELQAGFKFSEQLRLDANATFSKNKINSFDYVVYDTQYDPNTYDTVSYEAVITSFEDSDISFSPSVIAGGTLVYSPVKNLNLGFISKYVGEQFLDNTSNKNKSMEAYFVNNLSASYKIKPTWIKEIAFNLLVNNIFNSEYVSNGYTYSYYYRPQGSTDDAITENFYYPQAKTNFLLGMTLKF
ncbi:iron complex outermembrane receptor protein [Mariniflexile fucanivorans]|uniref:Iron complex outermembrane receptor protein n=1 Tax=Mariniflexile fucanivorans TaxID=264023 RepID=A0A4R1RR08_9FLAO|nr:TonB-dependent receptor [Mariniflexile fucanivorans]TCL68835.1 iron complex outermembrane receptor protein [Mariniflexile fucanivorans]